MKEIKPKYFLYARKSTEDDDHQIMSIEAQLFELHEYARKENLEILEEFQESKSAKKPGRELFNKMMARIESMDGVGIFAWHPDRLARNSVDGGRIIYAVDTTKIVSLRFPTFWFEPTPQGKFMLQVAFGQSKYYSDNLVENINREGQRCQEPFIVVRNKFLSSQKFFTTLARDFDCYQNIAPLF